jgi:CRISPR system Cascade subunit CasE
MSGFPTPLPAGERVLYRLDYQFNPVKLIVLVQSQSPSNWVGLERIGYLVQPAASKSFFPTFMIGQLLQFRLVANPTKRLGKLSEQNGQRVGLMREKDQKEWLKNKGLANGFQIVAVTASKHNHPDGRKYDPKLKKWIQIRQLGVRFDGILTVTDKERFLSALSNGIGSGKAMGFGLLSLARAN